MFGWFNTKSIEDAIFDNNISLTKELLAKGANPNDDLKSVNISWQERKGKLLDLATAKDRWEIVALLLSANACVDWPVVMCLANKEEWKQKYSVFESHGAANLSAGSKDFLPALLHIIKATNIEFFLLITEKHSLTCLSNPALQILTEDTMNVAGANPEKNELALEVIKRINDVVQPRLAELNLKKTS